MRVVQVRSAAADRTWDSPEGHAGDPKLLNTLSISSARRIDSVHIQEKAEFLLRRVFGGKGRAARLVGGVEVHQLEANAVGIVQVELVLAVEADLWRRIVAASQAVAGLERLVGIGNRSFADRKVIENAKLVLGHVGGNARARASREHVFEPVVADR